MCPSIKQSIPLSLTIINDKETLQIIIIKKLEPAKWHFCKLFLMMMVVMKVQGVKKTKKKKRIQFERLSDNWSNSDCMITE